MDAKYTEAIFSILCGKIILIFLYPVMISLRNKDTAHMQGFRKFSTHILFSERIQENQP